ncbi:MAG: 4'-phosphopantetheinyl transferase family protein, partial [Kiloniellaceae bacterium]
MVEVALSGHDTLPGQALAKRAVHISIIALDVPESVLRTCHRILDDAEVGRASRFRFDRDRMRWVVARASLRRTLSRYTGMGPEDIRFRAGAHGKPALECEIARLEFNMSHSAGLALIAVTRLAPVGVDIERVQNIADMDTIISSQFSSRERAQIGRMSPADRLNA